MTHERFNQLLNGPLHHPMPMLMVTRLALALRVVLEAAGEAGDKALEEYCAERARRDEEN